MPTLSYYLGIPNPPNNPSADVPKMRINTNSINSIIGVDHFPFSSNSAGQHQQVNLTNGSGTLFGNLMLHSNPDGGQNVLWANNGTQDLPLFKGTASGTPNGHSSIFGGIVIQWGSITGSPILPGAVVTFPIVFSAGPYSITLGPCSNSTNDKTISITTGSITTSGFTVSTSGGSLFQTLYWMAIGQ